jgi:hypothetical protein
MRFMMSRKILAEYDAEHNTFKPLEPLAGFHDHETVRMAIEEVKPGHSPHPWTALRGVLSRENGEDFVRGIEELFGPTDG